MSSQIEPAYQSFSTLRVALQMPDPVMQIVRGDEQNDQRSASEQVKENLFLSQICYSLTTFTVFQ